MSDSTEQPLGEEEQDSEFSDEEYDKHYDLKEQGLEKVLGPMHDIVGHAIIPFAVGGAVDMYYFPHALDGTAFVTMELINPDGSGPQPSSIGTYELIAFTKRRITEDHDQAAFNAIERRICHIFTVLGRYSFESELNPFETCEVPLSEESEEYRCLIFDEYKKPNVEFMIGDRKHGLLLCIEVFPAEMRYAMGNGSRELLDKLKARGYYPYSDLDREPVV